MSDYDDERLTSNDEPVKKAPVKRKPRKKTGRPATVLDKDQMAQVEALASVLTTEQIADYFGIGRQTFYDLMNRDESVFVRYKRGRAKAVGNIAQSLLKKAQSGDNAAMMFYLKTQAGWKETSATENTTTVTLSTTLADKLTGGSKR